MLRFIAVLVGFLVVGAASAATGSHGVSDLAVIPVPELVNKIPPFDGDGQPSMIIIKSWSKLENGSGVYLVLMEDPSNVVEVDPKTGQPKPYNDWETVLIDSGGAIPAHAQDFVRESSTTGVIFAQGKINGQPNTLLLKATHETGDTATKSAVAFEIYKLASSPGLDTFTRSFDRVAQWRSSESYCDAKFALIREFGLIGQPGLPAWETEDHCR